MLRETGTYEPDVLAFLDRTVGEDWVCIDGGANVGVLAVLLARLAPQGRVLAVEPVPMTAGWLRANVDRNGVGGLVSVTEAGLGATPGTATVHLDPAFVGGAYISDRARESVGHDVRVTTVDELVAASGVDRVDLLKLDIEGFEVAALEGAARTLDVHRPHLLVEVNPVALHRFHGAAVEDLWRAIPGHYSRRFFLSEDGSPVRVLHPWHLQLALGRTGRVDLFATAASDDVIGETVVRVRRRSVMDLASATRRALRGEGVDARDVVFPAPGTVRVRRTSPVPDRLPIGRALRVDARVRNRSLATLSSDAHRHPTYVGVLVQNADGAWVDAQERWCLPGPLRPLRTQTVKGLFRPPTTPGLHRCRLDVVLDGHAWLGDTGDESAEVFEVQVVED